MDYRALIVIGPGGVGKTTSAVVYALQAAYEGKRVGLLSIDPSKRLASALGLNLEGSLKELDLKPDFKGTVKAGIIDLKKIFDDKVYQFAGSKARAEKILRHPLYIAASTNLAGPLEYMSLAKFQEMYDSDEFDLVILDTPPDHHALDFLNKPNVLAGFMDKKIIQWLVKPFALAGRMGLTRVLMIGEKLMGGLAKVTGFSALHKLADFVIDMQEVIEGFHRLGTRTLQILRDPTTRFVLVASVQQSRFFSVQQLGEELIALGYKRPDLIINRCLPQAIIDDLRTTDPQGHPYVEELNLRLLRETELSHWFKQLSTGDILRMIDMGSDVDSLQALRELIKMIQMEN